MEPVTQVVQQGLLHYFERVCPSEHGIQIPVESPEPGEEHPDADCVLEFDLPGSLSTRAHLTVHHEKGNVCEVAGALGEGPPKHFSVCLSAESPHQSVKKIGAFLLAELQRVVGKRLLRRIPAMGTADRDALEDLLVLEKE
jgi:hypothetical protein